MLYYQVCCYWLINMCIYLFIDMSLDDIRSYEGKMQKETNEKVLQELQGETIPDSDTTSENIAVQ